MNKYQANIVAWLTASVIAIGGCQQSSPLQQTGSPFKDAWTPDQETKIVALRAPVDIVRDRYGVPHVYASNERDSALAMGYLHAQDRLFWMDALRHVATGRLTEYLGEAALPLDITLRRLMMTNTGQHVADAIYEGMSPELAPILDAYSRG